ncbi:hypothetical protein NKT77_10045 [Moraxella sp. FZLJ2107]|uniref:hypothetical protein n=1 Tax=unclassified Moraxella TaxID=2685852 RepID=UPI0020C89FBE|nr:MULTISPECIES: hypothetical protein [unclassified Moraxella]UTO04783.1 hypothetical protein NKT77_09815 [Moraxella sp. FZLJ2107]UTO04829.1 hypothetical protein NKT77_10045 [Moraxella sp. FZLJ2107]UTO21515.1 hypothetical protein NKU06_06620 [Moraxella sp. FZLJ2109]UTO21563.1 hypothetical protein NKU06_06860 [Moraxella sp. FZLJ2109]UTO21576.1 hypothetical protein NKU06_06925 [Moraxella sp. FZLJ2109]
MAWGDKQIKGNTANGLITITAYHSAMASMPTIAQWLKAWRGNTARYATAWRGRNE